MVSRKCKAVQLQQFAARRFFSGLGTGLLFWACPGLVSGAWAQPILPSADGTGSVVLQTGDRFDITGGNLSSNGQNLFHSFERFGLGLDQTANFVASPEIRNILGRVTGGEASYIHGLVQVSNGTANLMLINPAGILTGVNSRIDAPGSFTATTADWLGFDGQWLNVLDDGVFNAGNGELTGFGFSAAAPGALVNEGQIRVGTGQRLRLVGGTILNAGDLKAPGGEITLLSLEGETAASFGHDGAITLGQALPGQAPLLTLQTVPELWAGRANRQASTIAINDAGEVQLLGQVVPAEPGVVLASGTLDVSAEQGGRIEVLGDRVGLLSANIDASGNQVGGEVLIGGDYQGQGSIPNAQYTLIDASSRISADALATGDGGRVIAWADNTTQFAGEISATGGAQAGNGGFVEVSGKDQLAFKGTVDVTAPQGLAGTLLLDPTTITIVEGGAGGGSLDDELLTGDVSGSSAPLTFSLNSSVLDMGANTITTGQLLALTNNNIVLEADDGITITDLASDSLSLGSANIAITFNANADGDAVGDFVMDAGDSLSANRELSISAVNVSVGDVSAFGGDLSITAQEQLTASGSLSGRSVQLISTSGDIFIDTISAGLGGVHISAAQRFQARGSGLLDSNGLSVTQTLADAPAIQTFLNSKGITTTPSDPVAVTFATDSDGSGVGDVPFSIQARPGGSGLSAGDLNAPVTIRFGGATRTLIDQQFTIEGNFGDPDTVGRILVEGGDAPFFSGPAVSGTVISGLDDPYVLSDGMGGFVAVTSANYSPGDRLFPNVTYDTTFPSAHFPADGNGLVSSIIVGFGSNTALYGVLQDQAFDALPSDPGGPITMNPGGGGAPMSTPTPTPSTPTPTPSTPTTSGTPTTPSTPNQPTTPSSTTNITQVASNVGGDVTRSVQERGALEDCASQDVGTSSTGVSNGETADERTAGSTASQLPCQSTATQDAPDSTLLRGITAPNLPEDAIPPEFSDAVSRSLLLDFRAEDWAGQPGSHGKEPGLEADREVARAGALQ